MNKKEKLKPILNILYSMIGLIAFNGILQFLVYPRIEKQVGIESFGNVLIILSLIAVIAGSIGTAVNNSRMVYLNEEKASNGDFNTILTILTSIGIFIFSICMYIYNVFSLRNVLILNFLLLVTSFRYYCDVEYRKKLNYLNFMIYYLLIGIGYALGCIIYLFVPQWEICFLVGEILALLFVLIRSNLFKSFFTRTNKFGEIFKICLSFIIGELIINLILNADRLLLKFLLGSTEVSLYYIASLVGKIVALVTVPFTGVIMGYLKKFKGEFNLKLKLIYSLGVLGLGFLALIGCMIVSPFLIKYLYPDSYTDVKNILLYATSAQVIFFCANLLLILILKYKKPRYQLIINIIHLMVFIACSWIGAHYSGLIGFSIGAFCGNIIKLIVIIFIIFFGGKMESEITINNDENKSENKDFSLEEENNNDKN